MADGPYSISPDQPEMTLTVTLTDTAVTLGSVQLEFEREAPMGPCPICGSRSGVDGALAYPHRSSSKLFKRSVLTPN